MSRIGKQPIAVPKDTQVSVSPDTIVVKGPKGELQKSYTPVVKINVGEGEVNLTLTQEDKMGRALWGTYASHISNMIHGVNEGYTKRLIVEGIGYRAELSGNSLVLSVGYSHPVKLEIPKGIDVSIEKNTITISGIDKEVVGQFAAVIRSKKKPEPYKGKGIRYEDEVIRRKEGKKTA